MIGKFYTYNVMKNHDLSSIHEFSPFGLSLLHHCKKWIIMILLEISKVNNKALMINTVLYLNKQLPTNQRKLHLS